MGGDSEHEGGEKEHESWWGKLLGMPHAVTEFAEGIGASKEVVEGAESVKHALSPLGIPLTPALAAAAKGEPTFMQTVQQAQFAAQGSGGMTMASKLLAPLALGSGLMDMWGAGKDMSKKGATLENTPEMVKGGLEATSGGIGTLGLIGSGMSALGLGGAGVSSAAAAASPVGMVAGAGAAGMAVGDIMAHVADSDTTKTGVWGKTEGGNNKSAMDWGAGWGTWVDSHIGDKNPAHPSILGGIAAAGGGIAGGILGTGQAIGHGIGSAAKSVGNFVSKLW